MYLYTNLSFNELQILLLSRNTVCKGIHKKYISTFTTQENFLFSRAFCNFPFCPYARIHRQEVAQTFTHSHAHPHKYIFKFIERAALT